MFLGGLFDCFLAVAFFKLHMAHVPPHCYDFFLFHHNWWTGDLWFGFFSGWSLAVYWLHLGPFDHHSPFYFGVFFLYCLIKTLIRCKSILWLWCLVWSTHACTLVLDQNLLYVISGKFRGMAATPAFCRQLSVCNLHSENGESIMN